MSFRPGLVVQSQVARIVAAAAVLALLLGLPLLGLEESEHRYERTEGIEDLGAMTGDLGIVASAMDAELYAYANDARPEHLAGYDIAMGEALALRVGLTRSSAAATRARVEPETARIIAGLDELVTRGDEFRDALRRGGAAPDEAEGGWLEAQAALTEALTEARPLLSAAREDGHADVVSGFGRTEVLIFLLAAGAAFAFAAYASYQVRNMLRRDAVAGERLGEAERRADFNASVVSLASHELRNPLGVVKLAGEMIEHTAAERDDPDLQELGAMVTGAIRRAETLVAELLDMGRLDAGRLELAHRPVELRPLIDEAVAMTIEFRGDRPIAITGPSAIPMADLERLAIVLRNLIDNAFKYSPADSPVRIEIRTDSDFVVVRVIDSGPGIPMADRGRVFARFERLRQTEHIGGTGIGLHLSRELARRMGGSLTVQDSAVGACFELTLAAAGSSRELE